MAQYEEKTVEVIYQKTEIHEQPGKKTFWTVHDTRGGKYSTFDATLITMFETGCMYSLICAVNERGFWNIKTAVKVDGKTGSTATADETRDIHIARQSALARATELAVAKINSGGTANTAKIIMAAKGFENYILTGKVPPAAKTTAEVKPEPEPDEAQEAFDEAFKV